MEREIFGAIGGALAAVLVLGTLIFTLSDLWQNIESAPPGKTCCKLLVAVVVLLALIAIITVCSICIPDNG